MIAIELISGLAIYAGDLRFEDGVLRGDNFMDSRMTPETCDLIDAPAPQPWRGGGWRYVVDEFVIEPWWAGQSAAEQAERDAATVAAKIERLWAAADAYTSSYISGVAVGLLTVGVLQSLPKALAVSAWSSAVWDDYYARKALITVSSVDNLDFSSHGPMPHGVPELRAELGV